jgi:hypothetical protein
LLASNCTLMLRVFILIAIESIKHFSPTLGIISYLLACNYHDLTSNGPFER